MMGAPGVQRMAGSEMWSHFTYHFIGSVVLVAILMWSRRWSPVPNVLAKRVRWALLAGLILSLSGQALEALGAFGYPDRGPENSLRNVHNVGVIIGPVGVMLLIFALISTAALSLGTRFGFRDARWFGATFVVAAIAMVAFVVGGIVFGY